MTYVMAKKILFPRKADPFYNREKRLYAKPLPSREYIRQALKHFNRPVSLAELLGVFGIKSKEEADFARRLLAMAKNAQILCNRKGDYLLPDRADLIAGTVVGNKDGYGFCVADSGDIDDIFLSIKQMKTVISGDKVLVRAFENPKNGKAEGKIVEVTARRTAPIVGRVFANRGVFWLLPQDKTICHEILLAQSKEKFKKNDVLTVEIVEPPTKHSPPIARVVEKIGKTSDAQIEIEIALRRFNLPFVFPKAAQKECEKIAENIEMDAREDLRHLPFVTIDGADSRDFDDAVYCEKNANVYRLFVAIADVAHYVPLNSALDLAARERGNSVYFPRRVIPMLPEKLSNNLCSLNPNVDRLVLVCQMQIGARGKIQNYRFFEAVIHSKKRYTYDEVFELLKSKNTPQNIQNLNAVYNALKIARARRFALDFDLNEVKIVFNQKNKIEAILPYIRNDAHKIIEECMLAANVCAALYLKNDKTLFRIHEKPALKKLESLNLFLNYLGLKLNGGDSPTPKDYQNLITEIKKREDFEILQLMILRSLQKAVYSVDNVGHFGLAYEHYTHFTSPIRRYSDLTIHRLIKNKLNKNKNKLNIDLENIALHCSFTEKEAEEASREVIHYLKCQFMSDKINQIFSGTVCNITAFGAFIMLDDYYIDGLIHISELGSDYFHYHPEKQALIGENTAEVYSLGKRLNVQLVRVDVDDLKIDFVPVFEKKSTVNCKKISKKTKVYRGKKGS